MIVGSGVGSLKCVEDNYETILKKGPNRVHPLMVPLMISNMAAGNISIRLGLRGKCTNVATACASGSHCIGDAFRAIQYGDADIMVAGGAESAISPTGLAGFTALTALSTSEDPTCASRPFDKDRDGFVLGEGAGIIVLEELEHAKARGAKIYAELAGYGATADAWHITSPAEDGEGAAMAMKLAMREAGVRAEQIDYINAHGTSTHHNDLFETRAIRSALGSAADQVVVNSTKSMIGHLLGAAGGVEFIVCVKSIQDGYIHQTMGTKNVDPECDLNYAVGSPVKKDVNYVLTNSLGFGGHNASLLVKNMKIKAGCKMKTEQILQLVEAVSGFGLDEFEYEEDGVKLKLKKGGNVCTSVSAETAGRTKTEAEIARTEENAEVLLEGKIVKAPLVGIFYASPEEGGTPFVQAGDKVEKGTVLGIVEAMKLMNEIESDFEGTIEEVLVENGAAVEYGQPLFVIK